MVSWAFSGLSQKLAWPINSLNLARWASLEGMSKTVSELGQPQQDLVGPLAQFAVHGIPFAGKEGGPVLRGACVQDSKIGNLRTTRVGGARWLSIILVAELARVPTIATSEL